MHVLGNSQPDDSAGSTTSSGSSDEAQKRAIAQALWSEIHWIFPRNRTVTVTVDGNDIAVAFGPSPRTDGKSP